MLKKTTTNRVGYQAAEGDAFFFVVSHPRLRVCHCVSLCKETTWAWKEGEDSRTALSPALSWALSLVAWELSC